MTNDNSLSPRQKHILIAIAKAHELWGFAPSFRELMLATRTSSSSSIHYNLDRLTEKGLVVRAPSLGRTVGLTPAGRKAVKDLL